MDMRGNEGRGTGRRAVRAGAFAFLAAVLGCGDEVTGPSGPVGPITELPRALSVSERAVIEAGNRFAVALLRQVHAAVPDSTVFLSPLSASMALGMTMNGAAGDTYAQMHGMLGLSDLSPEAVNEGYRDLVGLLQDLDPVVEFGLANAIFHRDSFLMETPFLDVVRTYFDGAVEGLDFADPAATHAFDENATYTGPFRRLDGGTADVRFMTKEDTVPYRESAGWRAVDLPYGGGAWAMTVAVPRDDAGLDAITGDLESILDPDASWSTRPLAIHLPRFELAWDRTLNADLQALGMTDAFSGVDADFTPMYRQAREAGLHVRKVLQKTFLRVDEKGTEAAAVTVVEMGIVCACGPVAFRADRPFLVAIRERLSGTVLFAGLIVEAPED